MGKAITVGGKKGGTGKSTLVIGIAGALAYQGHDVIVLDCDTNLTCLQFFARRKKVMEAINSDDYGSYDKDIEKLITSYIRKRGGIEGVKTSHPYIECSAKSEDDSLNQDIKNLKQKYDYVIIDTGGFKNNAFKSAAMVSDITYIPIQPSQFDIEQLGPILKLIKELEDNFKAATEEDFVIDSRFIINGIEGKKSQKNSRVKNSLKKAKKFASLSQICIPRNESFMKWAEPGLLLHDVKDPIRGVLDLLVQEINGERPVSVLKEGLNRIVEEA